MGKSIGLIETHGMVAAYEGVDAALKAAAVTLVSKELATGGLVTMTFEGDVSSVRAAVDAGVAAVKRLNRPVTGHVIARLAEGLEDIISGDSVESVPERVEAPIKKTETIEPKAEVVVEAEVSVEPEQTVEVDKILENGEAITFNGKTYSVFKKGGIDRLKVVQLRQLARELRIDSMDRSKIKFANKTELISAIRKHMRGGE